MVNTIVLHFYITKDKELCYTIILVYLLEKEKKEIPRLETIYIIDIDVNPYYICF
jgi:hypothetical protein